MNQIKFGTDGWRAIIADDFTVENLKRVAAATAQWICKEYPNQTSAVVGYDCRFGGKMFSEITAQVFANYGVKSYLAKDFISTPMVSLAANRMKAGCGIIITASHNPASYNGFKIKGNYGGPALPSMITAVEDLIPASYKNPLKDLKTLEEEGMVSYHDFETMYVEHAEASFDMDAIRKSGLRIGYDAMFGAGQKAAKRLLPSAAMLHCEHNPTFHGQAPEPIMKNLVEFSEMIKLDGKINLGFATDGDADRIGLFDSKGNFVDSHHIILMLVNYLYNYKNMRGRVVNSFSCTSKIKQLCAHYGLENITTKIGFKYICDFMIEGNVMVGGEESGGIAVANHVPERDGIWIALTLIEYMAKSGKSLETLIEEVYALVGTFAMERYDLHIQDSIKQKVVENCKNRAYTSFGSYSVTNFEDTDGFKFHLSENSWVMLRASGTEPVLRIYAEAPTYAEAVKILDTVKSVVGC